MDNSARRQSPPGLREDDRGSDSLNQQHADSCSETAAASEEEAADPAGNDGADQIRKHAPGDTGASRRAGVRHALSHPCRYAARQAGFGQQGAEVGDLRPRLFLAFACRLRARVETKIEPVLLDPETAREQSARPGQDQGAARGRLSGACRVGMRRPRRLQDERCPKRFLLPNAVASEAPPAITELKKIGNALVHLTSAAAIWSRTTAECRGTRSN